MQYYHCCTILKCKFDFVNSKWKKSLVWENLVNSNICVKENKCISLFPLTCHNRHHISQFSLIHLMLIFTGTQSQSIPCLFPTPHCPSPIKCCSFKWRIALMVWQCNCCSGSMLCCPHCCGRLWCHCLWWYACVHAHSSVVICTCRCCCC